MMSRKGRRSGRAAWLAVLAFGWAACSGDGHPIRVESIDLAEGDYYGLSWGGTQEERFYVVARRGAPDGEVVIVSPEHSEPCSVGEGVVNYSSTQPQLAGKYVVRSPGPARVELYGAVDPSTGRRPLRLADLGCEITDVMIPDALSDRSMPRLYQPDLMDFKYIQLTLDKESALIDPWTGEQTPLASDVTGLWVRDTSAWFAESGEWVKRDSDGQEVARHGHDVAALTLLGENGDVAYTKNNPAGPEHNKEGGDLIVVRASKEKKLAELACTAQPVDALIPGALAFFAPCSERRLTVARSDGKQFSYESGVNDRLITLQGRLLFRIDKEDRTEIWMIQGASLDHATKQIDLPPWDPSTSPNVWTGRGGAIFVEATLADSTINIWRLALNGTTADFQLVGEDIVDWALSERGTARLQSDGTLLLTDPSNTAVIFRAEGHVADFGIIFGNYEPALVYRTEVDPDTNLGRLQLQFLSGAYFDVDADVRGYREVWWPERGLLYATGGATPKLRFARAEIPCQATSSAPWACNF